MPEQTPTTDDDGLVNILDLTGTRDESGKVRIAVYVEPDADLFEAVCTAVKLTSSQQWLNVLYAIDPQRCVEQFGLTVDDEDGEAGVDQQLAAGDAPTCSCTPLVGDRHGRGCDLYDGWAE